MISPYKIGTLTYEKDFNFRITTETASRYYDILVKAGTYPVVAYDNNGGYVQIHGKCTHSSNRNTFLTASSNHDDEDIGKEFKTSIFYYTYNLEDKKLFVPKKEVA